MKNLFILFVCFLSFNAAKAQCWQSVASVDQGQTMAVKVDGTLWGWGTTIFNELGLNDTTTRFSPIQLGSRTNDWLAVATGSGCSYALKNNGTLWTAGLNAWGKLGLGPGVSHADTLTQIGIDTDWASIVAGRDCALAIKKNGTLWGWGSTSSSMLGMPFASNQVSPVQLGTSTWKMVSILYGSGLGIKTDGTLWGWGTNDNGQIGDGTHGTEKLMTQVGTDNDWVYCSANLGGSCAIKQDGTLYAWGYNANGLAATNTFYTTPTSLIPSMKWKKVSAHRAVLGIAADGSLWVWGSNADYQMGDSTSDNNPHTAPRQIGVATNWVDVFAEYSGCFAINANGEMYRWGLNIFGEMGAERDSVILYRPASLTKTCGTVPNNINTVGNQNLPDVYPNPTDGVLYINAAVKEVILTNNIGQSWKRNVNNNSVDIRDLADGVYYLRMPGKVSKIIVKQSK